ncbi:MAG: molybdopterin-dependent oxidoreductase [Pseudolabrys sp.]
MLDRSDKLRVTRRQFGLMAGAAGVALGAGGLPEIAQAAGPDSAAIINGKKSGLIIHNAKLGVMETPLTELRKHAITPKEILFNRFHYPHEGNASWYATTKAPSADMVKNWTIRVDGSVQRPRTVTIADLQKMPQEKRVSVLQCAGNGRAFYAAKQKVGGGQWHNGGMGCVEWEGVALRPFLAGLKMNPSPTAHWLTADGWDQPATPVGSDFAKSYHIADGRERRSGAADRSRLLRQHERQAGHHAAVRGRAEPERVPVGRLPHAQLPRRARQVRRQRL